MNYIYVIIRHLPGAFPVAHKVLTFSWDLDERSMLSERNEAKDEFCENFPEFWQAAWYINKVN